MKKIVCLLIALCTCNIYSAEYEVLWYLNDSSDSEKTQEKEDNQIYMTAEDMPKFQGEDLVKFREWVYGNLRYNDKSESTRVVVEFVVEKDGTLSNFKCVSSPDTSLTEEVYRVLRLSPKWEPGKQQGTIRRIKYILPIDFMEPSLLRADKQKKEQDRRTEDEKEKAEYMDKYNIGPEFQLDVTKLSSLMPKSEKPIVVLVLGYIAMQPCRHLIEEWYDVLAEYNGQYDRYIVMDVDGDLPTEEFCNKYNLETRVPIILIFNKKGELYAARYGYYGSSNSDKVKIRAELKEWFGAELAKASSSL